MTNPDDMAKSWEHICKLWAICIVGLAFGVFLRAFWIWLTDGIDIRKGALKSELKELEPTDEKPKVRWKVR